MRNQTGISITGEAVYALHPVKTYRRTMVRRNETRRFLNERAFEMTRCALCQC